MNSAEKMKVISEETENKCRFFKTTVWKKILEEYNLLNLFAENFKTSKWRRNITLRDRGREKSRPSTRQQVRSTANNSCRQSMNFKKCC